MVFTVEMNRKVVLLCVSLDAGLALVKLGDGLVRDRLEALENWNNDAGEETHAFSDRKAVAL